MNYLLDDKSLISIRSRAITLRQLDPERIVKDRACWQVVNTVVPSASCTCPWCLLYQFLPPSKSHP